MTRREGRRGWERVVDVGSEKGKGRGVGDPYVKYRAAIRRTVGRILFRLVKILMSVGPGLFNDACISASVHEARPWQV